MNPRELGQDRSWGTEVQDRFECPSPMTHAFLLETRTTAKSDRVPHVKTLDRIARDSRRWLADLEFDHPPV